MGRPHDQPLRRRRWDGKEVEGGVFFPGAITFGKGGTLGVVESNVVVPEGRTVVVP